MRNMIYGEIPEFEEILNYLNLQEEHNCKLEGYKTCPLDFVAFEGEIDENGDPVKKSSK